MDADLEKKLELFDKNNRVMLKKYWFGWDSMAVMASLLYTEKGLDADPDKMEECKALLKRKVGPFSNLRGDMIRPVTVRMALAEDPEAYIDGLLDAYKTLQQGKVLRTRFETIAAMILHENRDRAEPEKTAPSVWEIYRSMRENHPLITDREDMASAALFAVSGKDPEAQLKDMEECYALLKPDFVLRGNEVQTMSALLAVLDGPAAEKCAKAKRLCDALKERRVSLNYSMSLPLIAGLVAVDKPADEIADAVAEAAGWLKGRKGFSWARLGKNGRITFASLLYMNEYIETSGVNDAALQTALSAIVMMEILITVLIITSTGATVAASSSD